MLISFLYFSSLRFHFLLETSDSMAGGTLPYPPHPVHACNWPDAPFTHHLAKHSQLIAFTHGHLLFCFLHMWVTCCLGKI